MVRDSLTGLLNHTTITEQLAVEVSRAGRQKTALVLVLMRPQPSPLAPYIFGSILFTAALALLAEWRSQRAIARLDFTAPSIAFVRRVTEINVANATNWRFVNKLLQEVNPY